MRPIDADVLSMAAFTEAHKGDRMNRDTSDGLGMTMLEFERYRSAVQGQYMKKDAVLQLLHYWSGGYDTIETDFRGACEKIRRAEALILNFKEAE